MKERKNVYVCMWVGIAVISTMEKKKSLKVNQNKRNTKNEKARAGNGSLCGKLVLFRFLNSTQKVTIKKKKAICLFTLFSAVDVVRT